MPVEIGELNAEKKVEIAAQVATCNAELRVSGPKNLSRIIKRLRKNALSIARR